MTESIFILLIANTTSVPTITPPASSMYWSTMMTSNLSFPQISSASSPVAASTMREFGAIPFMIRRFSIIRFILISSITRNDIGSSIKAVLSSTTLSGASQLGSAIITMHRVPALTAGSLSNRIEPPAKSTRCFAIANPSPVPGAPPRCTNRWKSFSCSLLGIPGPVSSQTNLTMPSSQLIDSSM